MNPTPPRSNHRPRARWAPLGLLVLAALGTLGCPDEDVDVTDDDIGSTSLLPGDLVISEVMANPDGPDDGLEWFEVYNASGDTVDLEGLTLVYEKVDGTGHKAHVVARSVSLAPGEYLVLGGVLDELAGSSEVVDYGYANELGDFGNMSGYLAIESGDGTIIDEIYYDQPSEGASRSVDGSQAPDATGNDNLSSWCDATSEFAGPTALGTPGAANDVCGGSAETCLVDGQPVAIDRPQPGELVITEVLADAGAVGDTEGEWFEFYAGADFHLNGLAIGKSVEDPAEEYVSALDCILISADSYVVMSRSADPLINGGVPAEVVAWEFGFSLTNSDSGLWLGSDAEILDAVTWGSVKAGTAKQLDPDFFDPAANDLVENWCNATIAYGDGDLGSPGAANEECAITPPDGQCFDADLGEFRDVVAPELGDLVLTEHVANPEAVADGDGEWFELLVKGPGDLNGMEIGKEGAVKETLEAGECLHVNAGDYLLFAHDADPLINGGLPEVDFVFDMALTNSGSDLFVGFAGMVWDQIPLAPVFAGESTSLDPGLLNVTDNDTSGNWCNGGAGTPGMANDPCMGGGGGMCMDPDTNLMRMIDAPQLGEIVITELLPNPAVASDADGEWFEVYAIGNFDLNNLQIGKNGVFSTTVTDPGNLCMEVSADSYTVIARVADPMINCGLDPVIQANFSLSNSGSNLEIGWGDQLLDAVSWAGSPTGASFSLDPGSLDPNLNDAANASPWCPAVDAYGCGDLGTPGAANPVCGGGGMMGQCLDGDIWRDIVKPSPGDLVISEFMANPMVVLDSAGEWFEVRALGAFDLNGVEIGKFFVDGPLETVDVAACIALSPGDTALLATNADPMLNGGLPAVDYEFALGLTNSGSGLYVGSDGVLLDQVTWTTVGNGASTSLDPDFYDPDANDLAANWCLETVVYGAGDKGTPKQDNNQCN